MLVNGTSEEQQYFASLLDLANVHSIFGSSLECLAFALSKARCLVTVDTGTMHLAAALGTPVIALFGPTNPNLTGPYDKNGSPQVLVSNVECQPCVKTVNQRQCTFNRCMDEISPERVFDGIYCM